MDMSPSANAYRRPKAIHMACYHGDTAALLGLMDMDKRSACEVDAYDGTPLHYAVRGGQTDCVKALLGIGAKHAPSISINALDSTGYSPLHYACGYSTAIPKHDTATTNDIITLLLKQGQADVNLVNEEACTPIMVACREGNAAAVKALVASDSDIDFGIADRYGLTALHFAALGHGFHDDIAAQTSLVRILLELGLPGPIVESALQFVENDKGPSYYAVRDTFVEYSGI